MPVEDSMSDRTADRLRDALEQDILLGALKPGERLDEAALAERFGVSRTPIREALAQLSAGHLVQIKPRRGAFVRRVTVRDVVEMFEVMAELEAMCARLAARRMSAAQIDGLRLAHEGCVAAAAAGDADGYYYENEIFHGRIYDGCANRFLRQQTETLRNRLKPYRRIQLRMPQRVAASLAEHDKIIGAIAAGDEEGVDALIKAHILIQGEKFNALLNNLSETSSEAA